MTVKELRTITGLSQRAFGKKYHIPTRTIEDWEGGRRKPSETILYLLGRVIIADYQKEWEEWEMKNADLTTKIYNSVFDVKENHEKVNKYVKAVIVNFGDERGDVIVENDNFGTRRKYADFTEGKKKAGLHPMQIVFSGIDAARACHDRYIDKDGNVREF